MKILAFVAIIAFAPQAFAQVRAESQGKPQVKVAKAPTKARSIKYILSVKKNQLKRQPKSAGGIAQPMGEICMPEQPSSECQPEDEDPVLIFTEEVEIPQLPDVVIEGTAYDDGWVTVCHGGECAGVQIEEIATRQGESSFSVGDKIVEWSGVRDKKLDICTTPAAQGSSATAKSVSNQTSESTSDPEDRRAAAATAWAVSPEKAEIMQDWASMSPWTWLDKYGYAKDGGYTVTITYSDGGTEQFKFIINAGAGDLRAVAGSLKPGSGTSKCPK